MSLRTSGLAILLAAALAPALVAQEAAQDASQQDAAPDPGAGSTPEGAASPAPSIRPSRPARPTIGIAFSGGGAKGFAHIGVLRVLEEMRIPIDYAAGTSMGSIVGGLYAAGLGPDELEETMLRIDWADALSDEPARKDRSFRRKDDDLHFIPDLEVGIGRKGLRFPTGLRAGQKLGLMLRNLTLPVRSVDDFDDLQIPFRAVATDIATGNKVVLEHGDLARALRASMAIPTAFAAVEIDGMLLVDGGVSDNLPVDVVREMGADVVIAIDIGTPLIAGTEVGRSYLTILSQTLGFMTRANMAPQIAAADLVITPEVKQYGTLEFSAGREIIAKGEEEARKLADELRPYSLSEEEYRNWKASRRREPDPIPTITSVRIEGNERVDSRILKDQMRLVPGTPYSLESARDDLSRIYGLGDFETVDAEFEPEGVGEALVYRVHEKPWGPTYLRFGFGFDSNGRGDNDLYLLSSVNRTRINALGAEWKTDLQLGTDAFARTAFYQPLSFTHGWFVEPAYSYRRRNVPVFVDEHKAAEIEVREQDLRLDLGYSFGPFAELRLGVNRGTEKPQEETGVVPEELEFLLGKRFEKAGLSFSGIVDRLDSATLPKNGSYVKLAGYYSLESLGADDSYSKYELRASLYRTRGRSTLFGALNGGVSPGDDDLPIYDQFLLGGFGSLSAFERGELRGDNFGLVRLGYYYRLSKMFHLGGFLEAATVATLTRDVLEDPVYTATAMLIADTGFGPLYLAYGGAEHGHREAYIIFGRKF